MLRNLNIGRVVMAEPVQPGHASFGAACAT